jgi:DNA topoisomerase IB
MRLRTVSCQSPGWQRVRHGRGFRYLDQGGRPLSEDEIARVKSLAIPPAWTEVWVCPDERGHLQAVGTDDAGRRQYLYHPEWRRKRDAEKFDRALELGRRFPRVRARLDDDLAGDPTDRATVLAAAIRLIDLGCFRPGAESYTKDNGSFGLTTLKVAHLERHGDDRIFHFVGKSGVDQEIVVSDRQVVAVLDLLTRRRHRDQPLLLPRSSGRTRQRPVDASEINGRIRELFGAEATAKDIRTWKATTAMAAALAGSDPSRSPSARRRQVSAAVAEVAELLGNTPTVARTSYIDPRLIDLFDDGRTIGNPRTENGLDRQVVRLLST